MITDRCPTCGRRKTRSSEQNRRYWKLVALLADKPAQGHLYSKDVWHEYLKAKFLGQEEIKLPSGKTITRTIDTHNMPVDKFSEFMGQTEAWCADHGVWLDE